MLVVCFPAAPPDPFSPFAMGSGMRINEHLTRRITFTDKDDKIDATVMYQSNGRYSVQVKQYLKHQAHRIIDEEVEYWG